MKPINLRTTTPFRQTCNSANQCLRSEFFPRRFWESIDPDKVYEVALDSGFNEKISSLLHYGYYEELLTYYSHVKTDHVPKEVLFEWFLQKNYNHICFDTFQFRTVRKDENGYEELEEEDYDQIHTAFISQFPWISYSEATAFKKIIAFSKKNKVDTYKERMDAMPSSLQSLPDILSQLTSAMSVPDKERKIAELYLRVWFTGMVHRAYNPGGKFDLILVLNGAQGVGKTYFLEEIFPDATYIMSNSRELDSKDKLINLSCNSVIIWDEIGSFNSKYLTDAIKQFLTLKFDTFRPVWGRKSITRGRRCVFAATTNDHDILDDLTGNRRFLPVSVSYIDSLKVKAILPALLGKIRDEYKAGKLQPYFTPEEYQLQKSHNLSYCKDDIFLEEVKNWTENVEGDRPRELFTTAEVVKEALRLTTIPVDKKVTNHIGKVLRSLGYEKKRIRIKGQKTLKTVWGLKKEDLS